MSVWKTTTMNETNTCIGLGHHSADDTQPLNWLLETLSNAVLEARKERDNPPPELNTKAIRAMNYNYLTGIAEGYQYAIRRIVDAMAIERGGIPGDLPYPAITQPE
jgi:hypothetical protein